MSTLHVTVDADQASTAEVIEVAVLSGPLVVLTEQMLVQLADELGGHDEAMQYLLLVSTRADRPIGCNFSTEDGSRTAFVAPASWTQERLAGWVAGRHEDLAKLFGPAVAGALEDCPDG